MLRVYKSIELRVPGSSDRQFKDMPINDLGEGSIVGDEILMEDTDYKYTVKVETNLCKLLVFERNANKKDFATKFLHKILTLEYFKKEKLRAEKISTLISSHPEKYLISQVSNSNPNDAIDEMRMKILGRDRLTREEINIG